ncbi:TlpA disulfide reductase family protein [Butyricimonas hominis]|uniref:redoxin domain-containing protein n=1 Tax=Butyricimonas TaxID=574697 RepID=UPI00351230B3
MRKFVYLLLVCIGNAMISCGYSESKTFRVVGEIEGVEEGASVSLNVGGTNKLKSVLVLTELKDGKFVLEGELDNGPRYCTLVIHGKNQIGHDLVIRNEKITVQGKVSNDGKQWDNFVIKGSSLEKAFREKIAFRVETGKKLRAVEEQYKELKQEAGALYIRGLTERLSREKMDSLNQRPDIVRMNEAIRKAQEEYATNMESMAKEAVLRDKDSFWGPLLMALNIEFFPYARQEENKNLYNQFSEEAKNSYYGQYLKEVIFPESVDEDKLPDFTGEDREGNVLAIRELIKGKKCVIIDFWASYCAPCRKAIPGLKALYADYADKGLEIISVSTDLKKTPWLKALEQEQMPWPNLLDVKNAFGEKLNGTAIPHVVVVDTEGKIVVQGVGLKGDELREKVKEVLGMN